MKNPLNKKSNQENPKRPKQTKSSKLGLLAHMKTNKKNKVHKPKRTGNGLLDKLRNKSNAQKPAIQPTNQVAQKTKKGLTLPSFGKSSKKSKTNVHSGVNTSTVQRTVQNRMGQMRFLVYVLILIILIILAILLVQLFTPTNEITTDETEQIENTQNDIVTPDTQTTTDDVTAVATDETENSQINHVDTETSTDSIETDISSEETQSQIANALKEVIPGESKNRGGKVSYDEFIKESENKIYIENEQSE